MILLAMLAAGCISDNASVAPRTMIRMHRTGSDPAALANAGQPAGTNTLFQTNALTNDTSALGVAPYLSQASNAATLSETNSLTGVNAPRVTTPSGTVGTATAPGATPTPATGTTVEPTSGTPPVTGGAVPAAPTLGTAPRTPATGNGANTTGIGAAPTGIGSTPSLNPAAGGSSGTGLGGTTTGSAIGLPSNTITGLTNNFLGNTNLFGPRQQ